MIPTKFKCKISKLLSYPVNASTLSQALSDVPQFKALNVTFYDVHPHKIKNPINFLSVHYSLSRPWLCAPKRTIEDGYYEPKWSIQVRPVPRVHVRSVRSWLDKEGLQRIRSWLIEKKDAHGKDGFCRIIVLYDIDKDQFIYETNDNLLGRA